MVVEVEECGIGPVAFYRGKDKVQIVFLSNYYNGAHAGKSDGVLNIIDNLISHDR